MNPQRDRPRGWLPLLRHPADRLNFVRAIVALPLMLLPALVGLPGGLAGVGYGLLLWLVINDTNLILHQHVHRPLTHSKRVNEIVDLLLSLTTGMSASAWRQHHLLRHHRADDRWTRGPSWEIDRPSILGGVSYSLRHAMMVFVQPLVEAFSQGVVLGRREPIDFRHAFIEHAMTFSLGVILCVLQPWFYAPYFVFVYFFTGLTDYQNHVGCDDSEYGFANNMLRPLYNKVRDNFGYHTAHHYAPDAHWTELPGIHAEIADRIPKDRFAHGWWIGQLSAPLLLFGPTHLARHLLRRRRSGQECSAQRHSPVKSR